MPPRVLELTSRVMELEAEVARLQRENDTLSKSEMELASERNKFADLYDFAPLGYLILTTHAEILEANLFAAQLVGLERRQFLGQRFANFLHADHREEFEAFLNHPGEPSSLGSCELRLRAGDGQVRDIALQKRHVHEADKLTRIYLTLIDITSRKQIEAERSQLLDEKEETVQEMSRQRILAEALSKTVNAIHESVNLSEVLDFIMGSMADVIPHDLADVMLIEDDHVHIARSRGYSQRQFTGTVLPIDQPISQIPLLNIMLTSHETLLISDLQDYQAGDPIATINWLRGYVGAPLLWQQRVIGFINLMSAKRAFFTAEHAERLTTFAAQAALAIRNAQLHEEARQAAVLQERQRLARDLHDAVSQSLYTSNVIAESLQILYETQPSKVPENLEKLHILNRGALAEMRTLLLELRPEKLEATSMAELLQQLADAARARTGLSTVVIVKEESDIPSDLKEALYRITQEAFTNVIKHAYASHVHARYTFKGGVVKLVIEDDGHGFDVSEAVSHRMGISNMQERMAAFGGSVEIESEIGGGTTVTATWGG